MSGFGFSGNTQFQWLDNEQDVLDILKPLEISMTHLVGRYNRLEKENRTLRDEAYKDNELAKLKKDNEELRSDLVRGFGISAKQKDRINEWYLSHKENNHNGCRFGYNYNFTPTEVGVFGECICRKCRKQAMLQGANCKTPAAIKNGFDFEVYNDYLDTSHGRFEFMYAE